MLEVKRDIARPQVPGLTPNFDSFDEMKQSVVDHFQSHETEGLAVSKEHVVKRIDAIKGSLLRGLICISPICALVDRVEGLFQLALVLTPPHHLVD